MRTWMVLLAASVAVAAGAQERTVTPVANRVDLDSVTALVVQLASCAALHAAAAEALQRAGMSDYAARARQRAEVDQLVTTYLLAEDGVAKGAIRRDPAAYTAYVENLTAGAHERMAAVVASTDATAYKREEAVCSSLTPLVDEVLTKIAVE